MKAKSSTKLQNVACLYGATGQRGLLALKRCSTDEPLAVLPYVMDDLVPKDEIYVPDWLVLDRDPVSIVLLDPIALPVANQVTLLVHLSGHPPVKLRESRVTFVGDRYLRWYDPDGRLISCRVVESDAAAPSFFQVDDSTELKVMSGVPAEDPLVKTIFDSFIKELEDKSAKSNEERVKGDTKGHVTAVLGVPLCMERLFSQRYRRLDPLCFASVPELVSNDVHRGRNSKLEEDARNWFMPSADYLISDRTVERFCLCTSQHPRCNFVLVFAGRDRQHPLIKAVQRQVQGCQVLLFPILSPSHYGQYIASRKLDIAPQRLAGLSLDDLMHRLDMNSLEANLRMLHEQTWQNVGGRVLDPADYDWSAVIGYEQTTSHLRDLVYLPHKRPQEYQARGLRPPKGILLHGPPGNGKTLLSQTLCADRMCTVIVVESVRLFSQYFGDTEQRLRSVFQQARLRAPCILVFDDLAMLGLKRQVGGAEDTTSGVGTRVLLTLLNELDGVDPLDNVTVIGCCQDRSVLDDALLRPGRMDHHLLVDNPVDPNPFIKAFTTQFFGESTQVADLESNIKQQLPPTCSVGDIKAVVQNSWLENQFK
jgi:hypothetical protein